MALTLATTYFDFSSGSGIVEIRRRRSGSSRIILTAQGSRINTIRVISKKSHGGRL